MTSHDKIQLNSKLSKGVPYITISTWANFEVLNLLVYFFKKRVETKPGFETTLGYVQYIIPKLFPKMLPLPNRFLTDVCLLYHSWINMSFVCLMLNKDSEKADVMGSHLKNHILVELIKLKFTKLKISNLPQENLWVQLYTYNCCVVYDFS